MASLSIYAHVKDYIVRREKREERLKRSVVRFSRNDNELQVMIALCFPQILVLAFYAKILADE